MQRRDMYQVVRHHYMGIDGDFFSTHGVYSNVLAAQRRLDRVASTEEHVDSAYDNVRFSIEVVSCVS